MRGGIFSPAARVAVALSVFVIVTIAGAKVQPASAQYFNGCGGGLYYSTLNGCYSSLTGYPYSYSFPYFYNYYASTYSPYYGNPWYYGFYYPYSYYSYPWYAYAYPYWGGYYGNYGYWGSPFSSYYTPFGAGYAYPLWYGGFYPYYSGDNSYCFPC
ncbi:MAG TPA: hypothetical protein VFC51_17420 [Chloroflexota bacterium]|nr:hypothetical protein [Chloroflexota bacterium]